MRIDKTESGDIALILSGRELGWFRQSLNECCHGFGVENFAEIIGVSEEVPLRFLDQIRPVFDAPVGYEG